MIAPEWKERFDADGFVNYGRVLSRDELAVLGERIAGICDGTLPIPPAGVRAHASMPWRAPDGTFHPEAVWQIVDAHRHDAALAGVCETPRITEVCAALLGGPVRLVTTQAILKPAHHGGEIPWHQDSSYWGEQPHVTCWIAIEDATPFNGCMRMIPGSHKQGQLANASTAVEGAPVKLLMSTLVPDEREVYVPVRAGCASFHHSFVLHASAKNTTPHSRRAIALTYALSR